LNKSLLLLTICPLMCQLSHLIWHYIMSANSPLS
jgi:hypothetical protein